MPSPKKCGAKFPKGSKAYRDCVNYVEPGDSTAGKRSKRRKSRMPADRGYRR